MSLGAAIALGLFFIWNPSAGAQPVLCLMRRTTSLPCPGCGLTRATSHLLHGEVLDSLRLHPFALLLLLEASGLWVVAGVRLHRRWPLRLPASADVWALAHVAALVAYWLGRLASGTAPF